MNNKESSSDPTLLKNVINALRSSKRQSHWHKPPKEYGPNNPEDSEYNSNGLKWVGDMSKTTLSPGFSFAEDSEGEECPGGESSDTASEGEADFHQLSGSTVEWIAPEEELAREELCDALDVGRKAQYARHLIHKMEEMKLEEEMKLGVKKKCKEKYEQYMAEVEIIHQMADAQKKQYYENRNKSLELEENQLRQRQEDNAKILKKQEEEYSHYVAKESQKLTAIVEEAQRREAEQARERQALLTQLQDSRRSFVAKITEMRQQLSDLQDKQCIEASTESFLDETLLHVSAVIDEADGVGGEDLVTAQESLSQAITVVDHLSLNLQKKKLAQEAEQKKEANEAAAAAAAAAAAEATKNEEGGTTETGVTVAEAVQEEKVCTAEPTHPSILASRLGKKRLAEIHEKIKPYLSVHEHLDNKKRMDLNRATAVINQLSLSNQSVNREKLQNVVRLLSGRPLQIGTKSYSTENDPVSIAYVKNHLASMIVKLGHDKQAGNGVGVAAYAWFMTELIVIYPDMWDLFLYHIFDTCPYLLPIYPIKEKDQEEEDFEKAKGLYKKEKADSFYGRMANAALMYGLVLHKLHAKPKLESTLHPPLLGWELIARMFAMPPISGVTAAVLHSFLAAFGSSLQRVYGKQFLKLMGFLITNYLPNIEQVTEMGGAQSLDQMKKSLTAFSNTKTLPRYEHVDKF